MLLRRFEAYGFKSFADKVEIDFGKGITAIVGPNGSGKSNISDAIRWVLGEQNIRNLRGAKTEDIIFAGSSERRPLNVAEVSLIYDNSDNTIPLDYSEVIITRRVYRSGESEYFINKTACRLKDIHDLLADIGLGRESMAVISQTKVDEVLNSRPEDRRLIFEDAAGITKFKQRKREAMRKLEDTETNITRVADIMAELDDQLGPLAESASRTEQYNQYQSELTACQVSLLIHKIDRAQAMSGDVLKEKELLTDQYIAESTRLSACEAEVEAMTYQLSVLEQQLQNQDNSISHVSAELEKTDSRIAVLRERINQKQLAIERVAQDIRTLAEKLTKADQERGVLRDEITQKREVISYALTEIQAAEGQVAAMITAIGNKEIEISAVSDSVITSLQEISAQRNASVNLERDLVRFRSRRNHLVNEEADYTAKLTTAEEQCRQLDHTNSQQAKNIKTLEEEADALASQRIVIQNRAAGIQAEIREVTGQIHQKQSRLSVLTNLQRDLDGFNRGSKSVLTSQAAWRKGICGAVAQVIDVPSRYLTAIEIALGGALQDIIAEDELTVQAAILTLKQQNAGRVTFLPISTIKPRRPRDAEVQASKAHGAVGLAADLVQCENRYRNIVDHLLGRVIITETLNDALTIAKQFAYSLKIVTLEGELINPGGAITGGSIARRESSYLGRTGEINQLKQTVRLLSQQQTELETTLTSLQNEINMISSQEERLTVKREETMRYQAQLTAYCEQARTEITRLNTALATVREEITHCISEEKQLEHRLQQTKVTIAVLEEKDTSQKEAVAACQAELRKLQQGKDQLSNQLTEKKIAYSALQQEIASTEQLLCSRCDEVQELNTRSVALSHEREAITSEISQAEQESSDLLHLREQLDKLKCQHNNQRLTLLGGKASQLASLQKLERETKDLRKRVTSLEARQHEVALMLTRYEYEASNSLSQLQDLHDMTIDTARKICRADDPQTLASIVKRMEQIIAVLGPVNPAAIDEYARIKDRYEFLQRQSQDLVTAKDHLSSIINDIDSTMTKRFLAALEEINKHFSEIFPRLFGGGKAQIELSDSSQALNSGIEIFVQPPGKKQQNLALLSGGERALTVIALLFSLLAYRPAPFSVVDEIDAALDEANVQRFSEFLREFSAKTQFIVVTHRKGTMEVADCLHGVTMEDSGVSRIVSVRFMDKAV